MATMRGPFGFDWESEVESIEWGRTGQGNQRSGRSDGLFDGFRFDEG